MTKLFLLIFTICSYTLAQEIVYEDRILAKVNGKVITNFELDEMTLRHQARIMDTYPKEIAAQRIAELKLSALEQFIDNVIILDEFKTKQFNVPQALIDKELEKEIKGKANGDRQKFAQMLDRGGISMEEYREQIMESIAIELMVQENVRRKINVTPIDISRYYDENKSKFKNIAGVKYYVLGIVKGSKSDSEFKNQVDATKEALQKEDFAKVAETADYKEINKDFKQAKDLNAVFKEEISKLSEGQTSGPVKLQENIYFLKLVESKGGDTKPLVDVRDRIKDFLEDQQERKYYKEFIAILRKKASIEEFTKK